MPDSPTIPMVPFRSTSGQRIEVVTLNAMRRHSGTGHLARVQRPGFVMLLMYTAGQGVHVIDYEEYPVSPGSLVAMTPGRTQQFRLTDDLQGTALVIARDFVLPAELSGLRSILSKLDWHPHSNLSVGAQSDFLATCDAIVADSERFAGHDLLEPLLRERLYAWLVLMHIDWSGLQTLAAGPSRAQTDMLTAFRDLIEDHFLDRWTIADYARKLGFAERTITRACLAIEGRSAKQMIDARLLLEVRRWLANSDETIETIAYRLRFGDASNLVQFFRRLDGGVPSAFRSTWRIGKSTG